MEIVSVQRAKQNLGGNFGQKNQPKAALVNKLKQKLTREKVEKAISHDTCCYNNIFDLSDENV